MSNLIGGGRIIYHGTEPYIQDIPKKKDTTAIFSLPQDSKLVLALGFRTVTKGWDIIEKMDIPCGWKVVINSSKGHYNTERYGMNLVSNSHSSANNKIIDLQRDFLDEKEFSLLLYASDAVLLPYKVASGSGVMFDALAHGIPFVASELSFFKEFSAQGLGITVNRNSCGFSSGIKKLEENYSYYVQNIDKFRKEIKRDFVASQHKSVYSSIADAKTKDTAL
jgi:glycosyltransferase involved in cell wall biosynthesis